MKRIRRSIAAGCILFTALVLILQTSPLVPWYAGKLAGNWTDSDGDILILLAAEAERPDVIGLGSYWRTVYAIRAWQTGHFRTVVVSGGPQPGVGQARAAIIGHFLEAYGIPHERIVLEAAALSTRENALLTAKLIGNVPGRKVLLTSDYHMFRAYRAFRSAGLDVIPRPFPDVIKQSNSWMNREYCLGELATETAKIVVYWARGWLTPKA